MNGIEKITEKITSDATSFVSETLSAAKAEAATIAAKYAEEAKNESAEMIARGNDQASERERRICAVAQLEARKTILAKKQELISATFDKAAAKLSELDDASYVALLCKFAVENVQSGNEQIILTESDRSRFGKQVVIEANKSLEAANRPHNLTLSEETRAINGGLLLKDGNVEINCALDTIVSRLREEMALDVANALFN